MVDALKVTVNEHVEREEIFHGEPTAVYLRGSFMSVLRPLFYALKFKEARHGGDDEMAVIKIGGYGEYGSRWIIPSNIAKAIFEASVELEKEQVQAMVYAIRGVSGRIERSIVESLGKTVDKVVSGYPAEFAGAEAIVSEILGNVGDKGVSWDASRKIADAASETVASLLKKEKKHGSKRNTKND